MRTNDTLLAWLLGMILNLVFMVLVPVNACCLFMLTSLLRVVLPIVLLVFFFEHGERFYGYRRRILFWLSCGNICLNVFWFLVFCGNPEFLWTTAAVETDLWLFGGLIAVIVGICYLFGKVED